MCTVPLQYEFRCLIPVAAAGLIIGRGGAIVKEIIDTSGCFLKLSDNKHQYSITSERSVLFRGVKVDTLLKVFFLHVNMIFFISTYFSNE